MNQTAITSVRSMTGQGHAERQSDLGTVAVEIRTVNNRGFKCSPRTSDSLSSLESRIEALARSLIRRGSVHLSVSLRRPAGEGLPTIDDAALKSYYRELQRVRDQLGEASTIDLTSLITLPGVIVAARDQRPDDEAIWKLVRSTVVDAIDNLNEMRLTEGATMAETLESECRQIADRVAAIAELAPRVVDRYRDRLETKMRRAIADQKLEVQPLDLLREVQIFADRADISEEITRLSSHLGMFKSVLDGESELDPPAAQSDKPAQREPSGRKLDFIIQEMFRETNTIGSKAADAEVSAHVVEIKCAIERMRELVQNLE